MKKVHSSLNLMVVVSVILLGFFFLNVSCSQEMLMSFGSNMEDLNKFSLGYAGNELVSSTSDKVSSYLEVYNNSYVLENDTFTISKDGIKKLKSSLDSLSDDFKKVTESTASDKNLRESLDKSLGSSVKANRRLGDIIDTSYLAPLTSILNIGDKINNFKFPIPITGDDLNLLAFRFVGSPVVNDVIKVINESPVEGAMVILKINSIVNIPEMVSASVGDRTEQLVKDKIAVGYLYDFLDNLLLILEDNRDYVEEFKKECLDLLDESSETYEKDVRRINKMTCFNKLGGRITSVYSAELDRILSDISAINYLYNVNIDVMDIISNLL